MTSRDKMIVENMKLVYYVYNRNFKNLNVPKEDICQEGMYGLIKAVDGWDKNMCKFSTYAVSMIWGWMMRYARDNRGQGIRIHRDDLNNKDFDYTQLYTTSYITNENGEIVSIFDLIADKHNNYEQLELYDWLKSVLVTKSLLC